MIEHLKLTKKVHLLVLVLSLSFTFIPVNVLLQQVTFIPGVSRFLEYFSGNIGFFNFSGISRLILYLVVYFNYDKLANELKYRKMADIYLIGICIYFFMSTSQVAAGRFGIYSLIFLVILLPKIISDFDSNVLIKVASRMFLIVFSILFFMKELNTLKDQTGLMIESNYVPFTNYFNGRAYEFDNYHYVYTLRGETALSEYREFMIEFDKSKSTIVKPNTFQSFISVLDNEVGKYIILNNEGKKISSLEFDTEPKLYKHYIKYISNESDSIHYINLLDGKDVHDLTIIEEIDEARRIEKTPYLVEKIDVNILPSKVTDKLLNINKIENVIRSNYKFPKEHYIFSMDYYYSNILFVMDDEDDLLVSNYYHTSSRFDSNNFFQLETPKTTEYFYIDGTRVWMVKK